MVQKSQRKRSVISQASIQSNWAISPRFYRMELMLDEAGSEAFEKVIPGQFAEFDLSGAPLPPLESIPAELRDSSLRSPFLRRPLSFAGVEKNADGRVVLTVLYCVLGPATLRMSTLKNGAELSLIGPLGNGFSIRKDAKAALLVAGGMGAPPLQHMAQILYQKHPDIKVVAFAGARSREDLPYFHILENESAETELEEFTRYGAACCVSTDDGTLGRRGFVTEALKDWLLETALDPSEMVIYTCGPEPMLAAVARLALENDIECQVSMERLMACGIGLCQSCAVEVQSPDETPRYKLCCKDGPIFDSREIKFL